MVTHPRLFRRLARGAAAGVSAPPLWCLKPVLSTFTMLETSRPDWKKRASAGVSSEDHKPVQVASSSGWRVRQRPGHSAKSASSCRLFQPQWIGSIRGLFPVRHAHSCLCHTDVNLSCGFLLSSPPSLQSVNKAPLCNFKVELNDA